MENEKVRRKYIIEARKEEQLNVFDMFLKYIQMLSRIGASRKIELYFDGDGQVQFNIYQKKEGEYKRIDQIDIDKDIGYGFIKVKNENKHYFNIG